jgi:hypothetical protein
MTLRQYRLGAYSSAPVKLRCEACEVNAHKLSQRQKQVDFGKSKRESAPQPCLRCSSLRAPDPSLSVCLPVNLPVCLPACLPVCLCVCVSDTIGYERYLQYVPDITTRSWPSQFDTPDVSAFCSKRAFDGQIRAWRRFLHTWDDKPPPAGSEDAAAAAAGGGGGAGGEQGGATAMDEDGGGAGHASSFAPYAKNDRFTKTGSGQT